MALQHIDWQAVYAYYISNEKISYVDCAEKFNISINSIKKKGTEKDWVRKKQQILNAALNLIEMRTAEELTKRNAAHAEIGRKLQQKAQKALETGKFDPKTFDEIRKALETGVKLERQALGMDNKFYGKTYVETPQKRYHIVWGDGAELDEY